jgi:hypothetical protein
VPQPNSSSEIDDHKLLKMVDLMVHHRNLPEPSIAIAGQLSGNIGMFREEYENQQRDKEQGNDRPFGEEAFQVEVCACTKS